MTLLILSLNVTVNAGEVLKECISFKTTKVSFDQNYFQNGDVEIQKVEQEFYFSQGGFGPVRNNGDVLITVRVRDLNYLKGFDINYISMTSARYLRDDRDFDVWEIRIKYLNLQNILNLEVFMPARWISIPTYGTRSNPGYAGPSYSMKLNFN
jgi:hypothetical protein